MYLIAERLKRKSAVVLDHFEMPRVAMYVPFMYLVLRLILYFRGRKLDYGDIDR
jgi:hypothetical protein